MTEELTVVESAKFGNLELVIETGIKSFLDVGRALLEIRDQRLYRKDYQTFEAYCQKRWDMSRAHANRLADAADTIDTCLSPIGDKPANESQVRPLAQLPREERASAWNEALAVSDGKPTAAIVEQVVANRMSNDEPSLNGNETGNGHVHRELSKGEKESKEVRDLFKKRLSLVTDGAVHTIESLAGVFECSQNNVEEIRSFLQQCEVSPAVKVHRTYGRKSLKQFAFVSTKCVTAHSRIRQLAEQIATDPAASGRAHSAAEQIISLLGG